MNQTLNYQLRKQRRKRNEASIFSGIKRKCKDKRGKKEAKSIYDKVDDLYVGQYTPESNVATCLFC